MISGLGVAEEMARQKKTLEGVNKVNLNARLM
jgi:hypothetical protein